MFPHNFVTVPKNERSHLQKNTRAFDVVSRDNIEYENDAEFTEQQLGELTPEKLMKWFNHETFDIPDPPVGHDLAPLVRTNTLKYWKKVLSFFMPNCLMPWNALSGVGNPTSSKKIYDLIK